MQVKAGDILKYKFTPDDVIVHVMKVLFKDDKKVEFLGLMDGYESKFIITKEQEKGWVKV